MHTDKVPRKNSDKEEYLRSDDMRSVHLPDLTAARPYALQIKEYLAQEDRKKVQEACNAVIGVLSAAYEVQAPKIKILSKRPLKVTESWVYETFGDYHPETHLIRLWMRTAIQQKPTSYGTLLATLCHEFCHHLDMVSLNFPNTFHTRGFYERTALIYHCVQDTPVRPIVWAKQSDGTFRVDWASTMRAAKR